MKSRAGLGVLILLLVVLAGAVGAGAVYLLRDDDPGSGTDPNRTTAGGPADPAACRAFEDLRVAGQQLYTAGATPGGWAKIKPALDPALAGLVAAYQAVRPFTNAATTDEVDSLIAFYTESRVAAASSATLEEYQLRSTAIKGSDKFEAWGKAVARQQPSSCA